jgi:hypothetical protein
MISPDQAASPWTVSHTSCPQVSDLSGTPLFIPAMPISGYCDDPRGGLVRVVGYNSIFLNCFIVYKTG